jgi:hypothetical protein
MGCPRRIRIETVDNGWLIHRNRGLYKEDVKEDVLVAMTVPELIHIIEDTLSVNMEEPGDAE